MENTVFSTDTIQVGVWYRQLLLNIIGMLFILENMI